MKIHHVGIAVESLKATVPIFEDLLGRGPDSEELVEDQKVRIAAFAVGESRIECSRRHRRTRRLRGLSRSAARESTTWRYPFKISRRPSHNSNKRVCA